MSRPEPSTPSTMAATPPAPGTSGTSATSAAAAAADAPDRSDLRPADTVAPEALHAAFVAAFADYLAGPFEVAVAQWPAFLARQGVDLGLSRVVVDGCGEVQAFAFAAPRARHRRWRLATMAARPQARGRGGAPALLADLAQRARGAGQVALELEVFAHNERALRLYQRHGFVARTPLHGLAAEPHDRHAMPAAGVDLPALPVVERDEALAWLERAEALLPELPLQLCAPVLAVADGWTAWRHGSAQLVFGTGADGDILIRSLVDTDPAQHDAEALARTLRAAHPGDRIVMPPLLPPQVGGDALRRAGFTRQTRHQWWMRRELV